MASLSPDSGLTGGSNQGPLHTRYLTLATERESWLERARDCSALTLPYLIPPDDLGEGQKLPSLYQSVGAAGVSNLASKLLLSMLPPNEACFRLRINDLELEKAEEEVDKDFRAKVEKSLSRIEQAVLADIEAKSDRPVVHEAVQHLIVGGNVLFNDDPEQGLRMFPLSRYVVDRDSMGKIREIIVEETLDFDQLPEDFKDILLQMEDTPDVLRSSRPLPSSDGYMEATSYTCRQQPKEVVIYTGIQRTKQNWKVHQECLGRVVPGSEGTYKLDACPWFAVRMYSVAGESYGRSFVEQHIGDLTSLESLNQALVEASTISSKVVFLVDPNAITSARALAEAENGAVIEGRDTDVTVMQVQKGADLQVTSTKIQALEQNLKTAFLMMDGVRRQAERVTAEEIRVIAQELETGLGGVYTVISTEFQLPFVRARMHHMQKQKRLPLLPKDVVAPAIVTGFEALGRGNDKQKLLEFLQFGASTFGEAFLGMVNPQNAVMRLAASMGIPTEGLIKTEEQLAQEKQEAMKMQEQMQMQSMAEKLGPAAIKELGGAMLGQQQPQQENTNG